MSPSPGPKLESTSRFRKRFANSCDHSHKPTQAPTPLLDLAVKELDDCIREDAITAKKG
jgi:hypothetical protein